jgi:hypothetical protein
MTAEEAWHELLADALASDGPIRDSDVKDAVKRNRPHIEAAVLRAARSSTPLDDGLSEAVLSALRSHTFSNCAVSEAISECGAV